MGRRRKGLLGAGPDREKLPPQTHAPPTALAGARIPNRRKTPARQATQGNATADPHPRQRPDAGRGWRESTTAHNANSRDASRGRNRRGCQAPRSTLPTVLGDTPSRRAIWACVSCRLELWIFQLSSSEIMAASGGRGPGARGQGSGVGDRGSGAGNRPGKTTFCRKSRRKIDITPAIVPKEGLYARNRCGKMTLGQVTPGGTIPGALVGAACVPLSQHSKNRPLDLSAWQQRSCVEGRERREFSGATRERGRRKKNKIRALEIRGGLSPRPGYTSRFRASRACFSMYSRRGSTFSPMRMRNRSSAAEASSMRT